VIALAGLDTALLCVQLATTLQGTQLSAECPRLRPGSCQPSAQRQRPAVPQWTHWEDHRIRTGPVTPGDDESFNVVLLTAHPPCRRTSTANN
jgi:hypothetical protein